MTDKQPKNAPEALADNDLDQVAGGIHGSAAINTAFKKTGALKKATSSKAGSLAGGNPKGIAATTGDGSI